MVLSFLREQDAQNSLMDIAVPSGATNENNSQLHLTLKLNCNASLLVIINFTLNSTTAGFGTSFTTGKTFL